MVVGKMAKLEIEMEEWMQINTKTEVFTSSHIRPVPPASHQQLYETNPIEFKSTVESLKNKLSGRLLWEFTGVRKDDPFIRGVVFHQGHTGWNNLPWAGRTSCSQRASWLPDTPIQCQHPAATEQPATLTGFQKPPGSNPLSLLPQVQGVPYNFSPKWAEA